MVKGVTCRSSRIIGWVRLMVGSVLIIYELRYLVISISICVFREYLFCR